ncbi:hypothetical protein [Iamia sp.]|uniref:hypothetical protein n=1 Tax=Iamia sp. TaxID=2722710 RepID=UPI002B8E747F|nr:hypothetical protein [Iamia sp.]HXH56993.1 hypothetical protein [Iamia sp.]
MDAADAVGQLATKASPEAVELARAVLEQDVTDRLWADQVGPALSQGDVARLLGVSEQAVSQSRQLLRLRDRDRRPVYPYVQFDGKRILPGLDRVLDLLGPVTTAVGIAAWLTGSHPGLVDQRPVDGLRAGDIDAVVAAAQRFADRAVA